MQKWVVRIAVTGALILVGIIVLRYTLLRSEPVPVTVFVAGRGKVEETVTNSKAGTVKTRHRARLSPETGGRVESLNVRKGDMVRAGSVLVRLDDTQFRAQVGNAERALEAARGGENEACLATGLAERDLARAEG